MYVSPGRPSLEPFEARIERYDDAPDECTIAPRDLDEHERTTVWISAQEGSFCAVQAMR